LWSANSGTKALFDGINIAYNQKEERNFIKLNGISLAITLGSIFIGLIAVALAIGFPALIDKVGLPPSLSTIISLVRWPILLVIVVISIAAIYKFAPDRNNPKFRWVSWGAAIAASLWIIGSLLFSLYINNFSNYDATYGAVAAVIILMLWFQLTSLCVLLGAEINSELEHQTDKDTTVGEPEPLGQRGGYYADDVAGKNDTQSSSEEDQNLKVQESKKNTTKGSKDRDSVRLEQWFKSKNKDRKSK
jgi:membrane protein